MLEQLFIGHIVFKKQQAHWATSHMADSIEYIRVKSHTVNVESIGAIGHRLNHYSCILH